MRLVVLAAGQGFRLDGFHKLRMRDPRTGEPLLARLQRLFAGWDLTVVLGYQAISVMNDFPAIDYLYNEHWSITGNSYSLSLALDDRPTVAISSDLFFDEDMVQLIEQAPADAVFVQRSENKQAHSVRCTVVDGKVTDLYLGEPKQQSDTETIGIYKVSDPALLRTWKRDCAKNRSVFAGINLPISGGTVHAVDKGDRFLHEVNTHLDYLNLIERCRAR
ncbi:MAG: NTP transferase domain-containing protein [Deltaproteobacteria bacterium]|nr:NTP transferase domain-containing protein [Deltaproteobacteria bacterium]